MGRPGIRELVGRAMVDEAFLASLFRDPESVLAAYDLSAEERAAVLKAVSGTAKGAGDRARAFQAVMMKRWAT
jgi:hypothetical protein